ncbi:hypothetical protein R3P38DRAFT_1777749 [Favolaschia claudopus]|uniref:Uncharacterized protein n=1 Tax=Favolaschia claudopus TaxID=2862362 RepID=A0AAW0A6Z1_9AGAR
MSNQTTSTNNSRATRQSSRSKGKRPDYVLEGPSPEKSKALRSEGADYVPHRPRKSTTMSIHAEEYPKLSEDEKKDLRRRLDDSWFPRDRCIITQELNVQHCHLVARVTDFEQVNFLIKNWGWTYFIVNAPPNIVLESPEYHFMLDHAQLVLIPDPKIIANILGWCEEADRANVASDEPSPSLFNRFGIPDEGWTCRLLPLHIDPRRRISRHKLEHIKKGYYKSTGNYTDYQFPYAELTAKTHAHPLPMIWHAGEEIAKIPFNEITKIVDSLEEAGAKDIADAVDNIRKLHRRWLAPHLVTESTPTMEQLTGNEERVEKPLSSPDTTLPNLPATDGADSDDLDSPASLAVPESEALAASNPLDDPDSESSDDPGTNPDTENDSDALPVHGTHPTGQRPFHFGNMSTDNWDAATAEEATFAVTNYNTTVALPSSSNRNSSQGQKRKKVPSPADASIFAEGMALQRPHTPSPRSGQPTQKKKKQGSPNNQPVASGSESDSAARDIGGETAIQSHLGKVPEWGSDWQGAPSRRGDLRLEDSRYAPSEVESSSSHGSSRPASRTQVPSVPVLHPTTSERGTRATGRTAGLQTNPLRPRKSMPRRAATATGPGFSHESETPSQSNKMATGQEGTGTSTSKTDDAVFKIPEVPDKIRRGHAPQDSSTSSASRKPIRPESGGPHARAMGQQRSGSSSVAGSSRSAPGGLDRYTQDAQSLREPGASLQPPVTSRESASGRRSAESRTTRSISSDSESNAPSIAQSTSQLQKKGKKK